MSFLQGEKEYIVILNLFKFKLNLNVEWVDFIFCDQEVMFLDGKNIMGIVIEMG